MNKALWLKVDQGHDGAGVDAATMTRLNNADLLITDHLEHIPTRNW